MFIRNMLFTLKQFILNHSWTVTDFEVSRFFWTMQKTYRIGTIWMNTTLLFCHMQFYWVLLFPSVAWVLLSGGFSCQVQPCSGNMLVHSLVTDGLHSANVSNTNLVFFWISIFPIPREACVRLQPSCWPFSRSPGGSDLNLLFRCFLRTTIRIRMTFITSY